MKRVMIVGGPGSGKSTLALMLGEKTGLPVVHSDQIYWKSGWVERDAVEKYRMVEDVHRQETWIFEGGISKSYPERLIRADTFIWLDMPFLLRFWRILRRTIVNYGYTRPDLPDGCPEHIGRESFAFWYLVWSTRKSHRDGLLNIIGNPPEHLKIHHFESLNEVREYLLTLTKI